MLTRTWVTRKYPLCQDQDLTVMDKDKDKDLSSKDQDQNQDLTLKDKDLSHTVSLIAICSVISDGENTFT